MFATYGKKPLCIFNKLKIHLDEGHGGKYKNHLLRLRKYEDTLFVGWKKISVASVADVSSSKIYFRFVISRRTELKHIAHLVFLCDSFVTTELF